MKKYILALIVGLIAIASFGMPRCGFHRWHGGHHHYHGGYWGRGGCHFWPGFVGGVVGGVISSAVYDNYYSPRTVVVNQSTPVVVPQSVVTQPVVVQQPIVQQQVVQQPIVQTIVQQPQRVWIEGRYIEQVQPNGTLVRVWNPGHYEYR